MATRSLVCYHSDIKSYAATWSAPAGTIDSAFPLTNQNSVYAHEVTKFTGTSGTLRGTLGSAAAIQGVVLVNVSQSLAGLTGTVTNNAGMVSQNIVVPALPADGVSLNAFVDLRSVTTSATQWNVAFSGAATAIGIGKVILIGTLRDMPVRPMDVDETKPTNVFLTEYDIALGSRKQVRYRAWDLSFPRDAYRTIYTTLRRGSEGPTQPFIWILDYSVNDAAYVWFPNPTWRHQRIFEWHSEWTDRFQECNPGQAY